MGTLCGTCSEMNILTVASRGKSGGQVRDEYREEYDPGRGGYGRAYAEDQMRREEEEYGKGR